MALINLSNHPSSSWQAKQIELAIDLYGMVVDIPFPHIDPLATTDEVGVLAQTYVEQCLELLKEKGDKKGQQDAVHIVGEPTFVFACVSRLKEQGIYCVASTTKRIVSEQTNEKKVIHFEFVGFRAY